MKSKRGSSWIVCQIGSREDYAVPRALHSVGRLHCLITDFWIPPDSPLDRITNSRFRRYHDDLKDAVVFAPNANSLWREALMRTSSGKTDIIMKRNEFFQIYAARIIDRVSKLSDRSGISVFSYSYASRRIIESVQRCSWRFVLGQIDPGKKEEEIVDAIHRRHDLGENPMKMPSYYWTSWKEEIRRSDAIVVNSDWSKRCLIEQGVSAEKLKLIPLCFESNFALRPSAKVIADSFSVYRPLRVLFLGQVIARKGVVELLDAMKRLEHHAVELTIVGDGELSLTHRANDAPNVRWLGKCSREMISYHYEQADVFIFPTHSDGFGLTQIEALYFGLPIIASRRCAKVVEHGKNGLLIDDVSAENVESAILQILNHPRLLNDLSVGAKETKVDNLDAVARRFDQL
jgi:glycosyltransferase involved in cell wall biosynthesis